MNSSVIHANRKTIHGSHVMGVKHFHFVIFLWKKKKPNQTKTILLTRPEDENDPSFLLSLGMPF